MVNVMNTEIATVNSLCDKMVAEVSNNTTDPGLISVFGIMFDAMKGITSVQSKIVQQLSRGTTESSNNNTTKFTNLGAIQKKPRVDQAASQSKKVHEGTVGQGSQESLIDEEPVSRDPVAEKFKEAIKDAERATLVFNVDLGKVPVMNKDTMNKRATASLLAMAAEKEKKNGSVPSDNTVEEIDDVLSIVKNMEFYGDTTKTYRNPKDKKSGLFCTVPIRYDFSDRDIKVKAESVLRKRCGIQCTTPYPAYTRECIRQIVDHVKQYFPDNFVRVNVDTKNMVFKVMRNPPDDDPNPGWKVMIDDIPIPREAMDVSAKRVPKDFKIIFQERENRTPYREKDGGHRYRDSTNGGGGDEAPMQE
jgi:hypothetical protein